MKNIFQHNSINKSPHNRGQAIIIAVVFFLFISMAIVFGSTYPILQELSASNDFLNSKKSFYLAEAGIEDVIYRVKNGSTVTTSEIVLINNDSISVAVTDIGNDSKEIISDGNIGSSIRRIKTSISKGVGADFFYGIQSGEGGFSMQNNSTVNGNVFSSGPVIGANSNVVNGDIISAGPFGLVDGVHATGTVYAHSINDSVIEKDAYYFSSETINNTAVWGISNADTQDQATSSLPISDDDINIWEQSATTTVISSPCPYQITEDTTLGFVKITCDLEIRQGVLTLDGNIWVVGNISIKNSDIRIDSSLGNQSVVIIADNPSDRLTSSKITIETSTQFQDSGVDGSYILLISQNESSENGGSGIAIKINQSASGDFFVYALHGEVELNQSADLKEVSAYKVRLKNSANVTYETGLGSLLFSSGPGGGWNIISWEEE